MFKRIRKILNHRKNLAMMIDLLGAIAVWWGIWGILDTFVFPGKQFLSYLISIALGFILLLLDGEGLDNIK